MHALIGFFNVCCVFFCSSFIGIYVNAIVCTRMRMCVLWCVRVLWSALHR